MGLKSGVITIILLVVMMNVGCDSSEEEEIVHIPEKAFLDALVFK